MKTVEQQITYFEEKNNWKFSENERADILSCINEEHQCIEWYMERLVEKSIEAEREENYMHEAKCFDMACDESRLRMC